MLQGYELDGTDLGLLSVWALGFIGNAFLGSAAIMVGRSVVGSVGRSVGASVGSLGDSWKCEIHVKFLSKDFEKKFVL